jgi:ATP-dependent DNA helicase RecG
MRGVYQNVYMAERSLSTEVQYLKGVGPRLATSLAKVGLHTVGDVLWYMPRRYEDRTNLPPIARVRPGQFATVRGRLVNFESRPTRGGMVIQKAVIKDETGAMALTWFNQPWIRRTLENYKGEIIAYGQVKETAYVNEISSPEWEFLAEDDDPEDFAKIVAVYPLTEGLWQRTVRRAVASSVEYYLDLVEDPLPRDFLRAHRLQSLRWCLRQTHQPESEQFRLEARKRLVFEEFFYMQITLALRRAETHQELGISFPVSSLLEGSAGVFPPLASRSGPAVASVKKPDLPIQGELIGDPTNGVSVQTVLKPRDDSPTHLFEEEQSELREGEPLWDQIHRMLPFTLTDAQRRVIREIWADMERPHPMNRLVQGDVGSGKTAVAACAILAAVRSGYQAALMAPTEILAEQHANNLRQIFEPLGIEVELLVGKLTASKKRKAAERTAGHLAHLAVGTHALIQDAVQFRNLGLIIVDEQHRFGVMQRKALRDKGLGNPDVLVMTATPIPRTLTMTLYGDLDVSIIDQLPPGRKPIKTHWKLPHERPSVYSAVRKLIEEGRQAYFVCPMVSESEKMQAQAAQDLYYRLSEEVYKDLRIGLLHGQMKAREKEEVMDKFRRHELDILVSTTVIEVGVDVPNSCIIVIEDANRFGLSQLHQLRGRVGRGGYQSFCILLADAKSDEARQRMEIMRDTTDGFKIAEEDLKLRGPGDIAGTKQSGNLDFKIADLVQDSMMLEVARQAALAVVEQDPKLEGPQWQGVLAQIHEKRADEALVTIS